MSWKRIANVPITPDGVSCSEYCPGCGVKIEDAQCVYTCWTCWHAMAPHRRGSNWSCFAVPDSVARRWFADNRTSEMEMLAIGRWGTVLDEE